MKGGNEAHTEQVISMRAALLALVLLGCTAAVQSADITEYYKGQGPQQSHYVTHVKGDDGPNGGFYRKPFVVCPDQYALWRPVTSILICQDPNGFVTGMQYFNEHPRLHYDPMTVCMIDSPQGNFANCTYHRLPMDAATGRPATITSIKVAKFNHMDDWRTVYMFLGFSLPEGGGIEVGTLNPAFLGELKIYQWYQKHIPGKICGLNGFYSYGIMCDKKTGYLEFVKPCFSCSKKPSAPKAEKYKYTKVFQTIPVPEGYLPGKNYPGDKGSSSSSKGGKVSSFEFDPTFAKFVGAL